MYTSGTLSNLPTDFVVEIGELSSWKHLTTNGYVQIPTRPHPHTNTHTDLNGTNIIGHYLVRTEAIIH